MNSFKAGFLIAMVVAVSGRPQADLFPTPPADSPQLPIIQTTQAPGGSTPPNDQGGSTAAPGPIPGLPLTTPPAQDLPVPGISTELPTALPGGPGGETTTGGSNDPAQTTTAAPGGLPGLPVTPPQQDQFPTALPTETPTFPPTEIPSGAPPTELPGAPGGAPTTEAATTQAATTSAGY